MRTLPIALGLLGVALCLPALAQEAAPPAAPPQAPAPVPAPAIAPAPVPGWTLRQIGPQPGVAADAVFPELDPTEARRLKRAMRHREKEILRLQKVMSIEGPEFDEVKYESYRNQKGAGVALVAIGGVGLVSMIIYGFYVIVSDISTSLDSSCDSEYDSSDCSSSEHDDGRLGEPRQRAALWAMLITGVAGIGIGVPLLVSGMRGKNRQEILRRKDDILAPFDPATATLSLFADPEGGGGLRLRVTF
jgi:hypothetical protein